MSTFSDSMPNLYTRDIGAAVAWYRDQLGFIATYQFPPEGPPSHVELRLGDSRLALSTYDAVREAGVTPEPGKAFELVVWCDDVDAAVRRLSAVGTPVIVAPHDHVAGHRRAYVADRDGNLLALVRGSV